MNINVLKQCIENDYKSVKIGDDYFYVSFAPPETSQNGCLTVGDKIYEIIKRPFLFKETGRILRPQRIDMWPDLPEMPTRILLESFDFLEYDSNLGSSMRGTHMEGRTTIQAGMIFAENYLRRFN